MVVFMCGETHYGEVEGAVSLERWSCNTHYGEVQGVVSIERWSCNGGLHCDESHYGWTV